jgi:hypothetical protein
VHVALWVLQIFFAVFYVVHAVLHMFPPDALRAQIEQQNIPRMRALANWSELLAAAGLVLPGLTGIATWLTPLAALGLVVVMVGAAAFHVSRNETAGAVFAGALAAALAFLAVGRAFLEPLG